VTERLKVGIYGITGCAGCQLSVVFNEDELPDIFQLLDVQAFPLVKMRGKEEGLDLVLMEGLVASPRDLEDLQRVRKNTQVLVALGACAHTGCVPAYRHFALPEDFRHLLREKDEDIQDVEPTPLDAHVKVDYTIPGCPPSKKEILEVIKTVALGKAPRPYTAPVCVECRRNGNFCLLELGKPCLGPITCGGCNAVCINGGFECWGCRGQTDDANLGAFVELLESKGFKRDFILERMRTFVGLKAAPLEVKAKAPASEAAAEVPTPQAEATVPASEGETEAPASEGEED
jgi:sulfhydrogenase subunit delta